MRLVGIKVSFLLNNGLKELYMQRNVRGFKSSNDKVSFQADDGISFGTVLKKKNKKRNRRIFEKRRARRAEK